MKAFLLIISKVSMVLFLIAAPFLFVGFGRELLIIVKSVSLSDARWKAFLIGAIIFLPVHFLAKRFFYRLWCYLETLEHELTHLLIGLLFLKIPVGIRVSAHEGGEVRQIGFGSTGQIWVTLAPYFFPTVSLFVLIVAYFANPNNLTLLGILGWTTAFHLVSNWGQTSFRQSDLQKAGILKTLLILPVMNLICYGAVLAFVAGGSRMFFKFFTEGFWQTVEAFTTLTKGIF
ncbi:MAG: M50 family metallopeptidase [Pyrinomonadaceae bacterium]